MSQIKRLSLLLSIAIWAAGVAAQDFPVRPIRIIAPSAPGGGFDLVARTFAQQLSTQFGRPVVVENRSGAGTLIGTRAAAQAAPDGYTLAVGSLSNIVMNAALYRDVGYDALADFVPIGMAVAYSYIFIARANLPQSSLADVVEFARANPGKLTFASSGLGTGQHVGSAIVFRTLGIDLLEIQHKGAQAAYPDIISGRVDIGFDNTSTARAYIDSGQVKALAVSSRGRHPALPSVPTIAETGLMPFELESWFGLFARSGTPGPVLVRLRSEVQKAARAPDVVARFEKSGGRIFHLADNELAAFVMAEYAKWGGLVRKAGVKLD